MSPRCPRRRGVGLLALPLCCAAACAPSAPPTADASFGLRPFDGAVGDSATDAAAVPDIGGPDSAAPDSAAPDSAAPDSAAPDSAAPDSAAPDSLVLDSAATDSVATDGAQVYDAALADASSSSCSPALPEDVSPDPAAGLPFGYLDQPGFDTELHGAVHFAGWVLSVQPLSRVELWIDGTLFLILPQDEARPDVCAAFPNLPCSSPGFDLEIDLSGLERCHHLIEVHARTADDALVLIDRARLNLIDPA
jgi:hypothetical protein